MAMTVKTMISMECEFRRILLLHILLSSPLDEPKRASTSADIVQAPTMCEHYQQPPQGTSAGVMSEGRRAALRHIEVQVIDYQDELESGRADVPTGGIDAAVRTFRQSLLDKVCTRLTLVQYAKNFLACTAGRRRNHWRRSK
jgi:hypothetical protein